MGRIIASVRIENVLDDSKSVRCDALVDTGASLMVLPSAWRDRLGGLKFRIEVDVGTATQEVVRAEVCGPVRIQIEGFRPIFNEVAFIDMKPANGDYEPLIGYLVLEQSQAAVDILGHRLVQVKHMDLKYVLHGRSLFATPGPSNHIVPNGGSVICAE
jgi:predicted aspartyl protease